MVLVPKRSVLFMASVFVELESVGESTNIGLQDLNVGFVQG